ncbi:hypothetical protein DACRYDRAFT_107809 [Dacryopinax primogenitus]|uniref:Uncharacterized protein n=1 Tax=Dacryopinax primogenitus (strain DJM 731) TaxID=1858805 RepID=M5GB97_DACPD|nr:uncharacterized protein DACRYDRAFT_107809 [Dacryopinax primogenitus]EJU01253.1 hypothetical protein DACRYDRAFT_107809 [Dacryopinax primogenitus]
MSVCRTEEDVRAVLDSTKEEDIEPAKLALQSFIETLRSEGRTDLSVAAAVERLEDSYVQTVYLHEAFYLARLSASLPNRIVLPGFSKWLDQREQQVANLWIAAQNGFNHLAQAWGEETGKVTRLQQEAMREWTLHRWRRLQVETERLRELNRRLGKEYKRLGEAFIGAEEEEAREDSGGGMNEEPEASQTPPTTAEAPSITPEPVSPSTPTPPRTPRSNPRSTTRKHRKPPSTSSSSHASSSASSRSGPPLFPSFGLPWSPYLGPGRMMPSPSDLKAYDAPDSPPPIIQRGYYSPFASPYSPVSGLPSWPSTSLPTVPESATLFQASSQSYSGFPYVSSYDSMYLPAHIAGAASPTSVGTVTLSGPSLGGSSSESDSVSRMSTTPKFSLPRWLRRSS